MTAKPRKPLLLNLTWAVVLLVGIPMAYVASFALCWWLWGRGAISWDTCETMTDTVFYPLVRYVESDLPGGDAVNRLVRWSAALDR